MQTEDGVAHHEWTYDYRRSSAPKRSYQPTTTTLPSDKPARYDEAKTWYGLQTLIAPFSALKNSSDTPSSLCCTNFNNCALTPKACESLSETIGEKALANEWKRLRHKVIGDIGFQETTKKYLAHTGLLRAEVTFGDGGGLAWTFYASAANVCLVNGAVVHLITGETQSSSGSCHTEQLCMYWLHKELATLHGTAKVKTVDLRWYTELPMCKMWCIPALKLFITHWKKIGRDRAL